MFCNKNVSRREKLVGFGKFSKVGGLKAQRLLQWAPKKLYLEKA